MGLSREKALARLREYVKNEKTIIHSLASEAVMRALALRLNEDEDRWGLTGLLHDIDVELTNADPKVHALAAGETITGLIYATTLVYPDKKIESVKYKSVRKRMKEKAFAASVNRDHILECEEIGIPLDEFVQLSVDAMRGISAEIGL